MDEVGFDSREDVYIRVADGIGAIVLNRAAKRNAISEAMWDKLPVLLDLLEANAAVRLITITGAGAHFGAGNDIAELPSLHAEASKASRFAQTMAAGIARLASCSKPTVAVIKGQCYGASLALTLAADLRFAADDAVFAITPAKLGALYLKSDMVRLFDAVGRARGLEMIYSARALDAGEASTYGLVNRTIPTMRFDDVIADLQRQIVSLSLFTMVSTKAMMRGSCGDPHEEDADSLAWWISATQSSDFKEGVSAFLDRRVPQFHPGASSDIRLS